MESRDIILKLISEQFPSDKAFEDVAGLKPKTVDSWKRNNSKGYLKILPKLSEVFGVTTDYLLGNEQKNKPVTRSDELDPLDKKIIELFSLLNSDNQKIALAQIETLLRLQEKK